MGPAREEEKEEEEFIQNSTRAGHDSERGGASMLSRNAGLNQSADETRTPVPAVDLSVRRRSVNFGFDFPPT